MDNSTNSSKNGVIGNIDLRCEGESTAVDLTNQIHQLPCCIKHNGPCSVSDYFKPQKTGIETEGLGMEEAYFRGRKLQGANIPLPEGYRGFVLGKKGAPAKRKAAQRSGEDTNSWEALASFQSITYWNHDTPPSNNDTFLRCMHLFSVANALHKPVSADDLAYTSSLPG